MVRSLASVILSMCIILSCAKESAPVPIVSPSVVSTEVTDISPSSAIVNSVITLPQSVALSFFLLKTGETVVDSIGGSIIDNTLTAKLNGLEDTTTYSVCAVLFNGNGQTINGKPVVFTTLKKLNPIPEVISTEVTGVTVNGASLAAKIKYPEYVTESLFEVKKGGQAVGKVDAVIKQDIMSADLTGLSDSTEFTVTAVVKDAKGNVRKGNDVSFTTLKKPDPLPEISATAVTNITVSSAYVTAKVKYPEYVTDSYVQLSRGNTVIRQFNASIKNDTMTAELTDLSDTTEYRVTAIVKNKAGNVIKGDQVTFTTLKQHEKIVSFEDKNFKAYCVASYDTNHDGEISYAEAEAVTYIDCNSKSISSLSGLEHFSNLTHLSCWKNNISTLDISSNTALTYLNCDLNQISNLNLTNNTALYYLACSGNQFSSIDVSKNVNLKILYSDNNKLTSIDISQNPLLEELRCSENQLTSLDLSHNPALKHLDFHRNQISTLDITKNTALEYLSFWNNKLSLLDLSSNTKLTYLNCDLNQISNLNLTNNTALYYLACSGNQFSSLDVSKNVNLKILYSDNNKCTSIDVSKNPLLEELRCSKNQLTSLDVSNNSKLKELLCTGNPSLTEIWLKEGQTIANFSYDSSISTIHYK